MKNIPEQAEEGMAKAKAAGIDILVSIIYQVFWFNS